MHISLGGDIQTQIETIHYNLSLISNKIYIKRKHYSIIIKTTLGGVIQTQIEFGPTIQPALMSRTSPSEGYVNNDDDHGKDDENEVDENNDNFDDLRPRYVNNDL